MAASNIYSLEPTTRGAVLLRTTAGELLVELFARECPLAVRNFCQLCVDGAYDGVTFSRVVPGTLVQAGNDGKDESSFEGGGSFKDEFHSRLEFRGRGLVAMANEGKPNSNRAHFFITLKPCPWLNRKHTIFGIVRGEAAYVAVKIGESPVEGERALFPSIVKQAIIVEQPFPDDPIIPRAKLSKLSTNSKVASTAASTNLLKKMKPASALSFAMDDNEDEDVVPKIKVGNPALRPTSNPKGEHKTAAALIGTSVVKQAPSESEESNSSSSEEEEEVGQTLSRDNALAAKLQAFAKKRTTS